MIMNIKLYWFITQISQKYKSAGSCHLQSAAFLKALLHVNPPVFKAFGTFERMK